MIPKTFWDNLKNLSPETMELMLQLAILVSMISILFLLYKNRNKFAPKSVQKSAENNIALNMTPKECLRFFHSILNIKFTYWYQAKLAPNILSGKSTQNTPTLVKETKSKFISDTKLAINPSIMNMLLSSYFLNIKSIDIYIDQYFIINYNKIEGDVDKMPTFYNPTDIPKGGIINAV